MSDLLLVHGTCHGAWCWDYLIPELRRHGINARAIDLPGTPANPMPVENVALDSYADAILERLDTRTVLLGHSAGGFPITAAAQRAPEKIAALIYLCAYVPLAGKSLADMRRMAPRQPIMEAVCIAPDRKTFTIDPALAPEKFYNDVGTERAAWATQLLCPQPIAPQETALINTAAAEGLPRHYIRCTKDETIPPEFQKTMSDEWKGGKVVDIPTSHSPFLSDPEGLANVIASLLNK